MDIFMDIDKPSNLTEIVSMIGMDGTASRARLRYPRDFLTPGICSLIKPAAMVNLMPVPAKIHTVML